MIDRDDQITASEDEVARLVQGVCYCQCFAFDGGVARLGWMCKSGAYQCDFPTLLTTEDLAGRALAVLLE